VIKQLLADERIEARVFLNGRLCRALSVFEQGDRAGGAGAISRESPARMGAVRAKAAMVVRKDEFGDPVLAAHPACRFIQARVSFSARAVSAPKRLMSDGADALQLQIRRPFLQNYLPFWMASLVGGCSVCSFRLSAFCIR